MTTPDYFTASFWRSTLNHIIFCVATGAANAWFLGGIGSVDADTHLSIPGWGVAVGAVSGATFGLLLSLLGQALPNTPPTSFVPAKAAAKPRPRKAPAKAPTTADLKKPVKKAPAAKKPPAK